MVEGKHLGEVEVAYRLVVLAKLSELGAQPAVCNLRGICPIPGGYIAVQERVTLVSSQFFLTVNKPGEGIPGGYGIGCINGPGK